MQRVTAKVLSTAFAASAALFYSQSQSEEKFLYKFHKTNMFSQGLLFENITQLGKSITNPKTLVTTTKFRLGKTDEPSAIMTIFDEYLARAAFPYLPHKVGVTGTLKINKIHKLPGEKSTIVLKCWPTNHKGRKSEASGEIRILQTNELVCTADIIMIEPGWARYLSYFM